MNICWVLPENFTPTETLSVEKLKEHGPIWGPYSIWSRVWQDNVVSNDINIVRQLLSHNIQKSCNLWVNDDFYIKLNRPDDINTFQWAVSAEINSKEELIGLQLASTRYDIILCPFWDLHSINSYEPNTVERHLRQNYLNYITAIVKNTNTQFVFIAPQGNDIHPGLTVQDNFSTDSVENTLELLKQL